MRERNNRNEGDERIIEEQGGGKKRGTTQIF